MDQKIIEQYGYETIIFDCDSTISTIEGIDELANLKGKKAEVKCLTEKAMNGELSFEEVFDLRLNIIKPRYNDLQTIGKMYVDTLIQDIKEVIEILKFLGKRIYIITGGYEEAVKIVGKVLNIEPQNIFANKLFFNSQGEYSSYEKDNPLSHNQGKKKVIERLLKNNETSIFIGDSMTDLEVQDSVSHFVGYGGVARRESVLKNTQIYVESESMIGLLPLLIGRQGSSLLKNTKYQNLYNKGIKNLIDKKVIFKDGFDKIIEKVILKN